MTSNYGRQFDSKDYNLEEYKVLGWHRVFCSLDKVQRTFDYAWIFYKFQPKKKIV